MKNTTGIEILQTLHGAAIVGFVASLPISIAFCQISLALSWLFWLLLCIVRKQWPGFTTPLDIWFLIFFLLSVVSSLLSLKPIESVIGLKKFYLLSAVYMIAFSVKEKNRFMELMSLFVIMTSLAGLYGIVLYLLQGGGKLVATQSMAMTSGGIFMLASTAMVPLLFRDMRNGLRHRIWIKAILTAILSMSLFLTKTISSWLGFISGLLIIGLRKGKYILMLGLMSMVLILVYALYRPHIDFLSYDKNESMTVRILMWETAWKMFRERPYWGWGLIDLGEISRNYRTDEDLLTRGYITFGHMHNNFIHIAVTMGSFGLLAFCIMWGAILWQIYREERRVDPKERILVRAIGGAIVGFLVNGMAEWNFGDSEVITIIWFLVGLLLSANHYGYLSTVPEQNIDNEKAI